MIQALYSKYLDLKNKNQKLSDRNIDLENRVDRLREEISVIKKENVALLNVAYDMDRVVAILGEDKVKESIEVAKHLEQVNVKQKGKKYMIRVGDKVLNTKNNYKCTNTDGDVTPVFNGNIGIVKEIEDNGYCTIDFVGIGEVLFSKGDSKNLELAYACTVHKMQGSGFTSTIVGMDTGSYIMNNSELLYTAITRAKKYCVLVGNNYAITKAIQTKEVKTKQTFLKDMLLENAYRLKEDEKGE